jgi:hypothetical protein
MNGSGGNCDGLLLGIEHWLSETGFKNSGGGSPKRSITRVPNSIRCFNGEKSFALDREVQRIAGRRNLSLAKIKSISTENAKIVYGVAYL